LGNGGENGPITLGLQLVLTESKAWMSMGRWEARAADSAQRQRGHARWDEGNRRLVSGSARWEKFPIIPRLVVQPQLKND
jgi:hypothetical protein